MTQTPPRGNALAKSQERIYSGQQLSMAMKSGMSAVREQLQVLSILDGTAASWPGMNQSVDDMDFLVDMATKMTTRLEGEIKTAETRAQDCREEVMTLKETMANANERSEQLQQDLAQSNREAKQLTKKLESATNEVNQQRQELWTLEKQRADLASEVEKYKQDNDFMEGEINTLRSTVNDQMQQLTSLKEELAARKSDVQHLQRSTNEHKAAATDFKKRLDGTTATLRATQSQLEHMRTDKAHFENESARLAEESSRLGAELTKTSTELQRLKDWGEVVKKVEADKLREEQAAHTRMRFEADQAKLELEKAVSRLTAELDSKDERVLAKTAEAASASKQFGLLNIQIKDLQKQVTTIQAEKAATLRERDEFKTEVAKLQTKLQASAMQIAKLDKDRATSEGKAREAAMMERAKLVAASEEARKESAVQKALSDGWSRDLRETQGRLQAEQAISQDLRKQLDAALRGAPNSPVKVGDEAGESKRMEMVKNLATAEQVAKDLRAQLDAKDTEFKRFRAESTSKQKQLEKQVESLQRECNECALEIQRLRTGEAGRLPAVAARPVSLQDELDNLKRYVHHGPNGAVPSRLPPAVKQVRPLS